MSSLSQIGVPGIGTGILHPKRTHWFQVRFEKQNDPESKTTYTGLAMQLVSITHNTRPTLTPFGIGGQLEVVFDDDITNRCLQELIDIAAQQEFTVYVDYLDGYDGVSATWVYTGCSLTMSDVTPTELNYVRGNKCEFFVTIPYNKRQIVLKDDNA